MSSPARTAPDQIAMACLRDATPRSADVLGAVLERWNGLTDAQRARVYSLVEQLHRTSAIRRGTRALLDGA
jgi:hypothetical protein